ncbi:MAG: cation/H(+) antiporter, partial [Thermoplasmata archaeon]|nr:cation/H(+) antiporter [Thermoplasmata archaeon]
MIDLLPVVLLIFTGRLFGFFLLKKGIQPLVGEVLGGVLLGVLGAMGVASLYGEDTVKTLEALSDMG